MVKKEQATKPVFRDGRAQPVFPFTDGKTGDAYDPAASAVVRYCVYVESDHDMDGDGKRDLVKAFIQVPRAAAEGNYRTAAIFEARPYCAGVQVDGYDHMKAVEEKKNPGIDISALDRNVPPRTPSGYVSALELAERSDPSDWYYEDKGHSGSFCYENIDAYDYYLVRGFAVVESAGFGTLGSDGFVYVGSKYERDAFRAVVEWLHGDRTAYADRSGTVATEADWSNGRVGMTGRSYAGTMPFAVAATGVAGLETIVPVAGISDWYSFLNQQGAQRYWPKEMLMSFLAYYCSSRYNDESLTKDQIDDIAAFHQQFSCDQLKSGFDYDSGFWGEGNYTLEADNIKCSALIVHGFNDENVSTKQFEMMLHSFEKAGKAARLILHQGPHMTPTMAAKGYGISIDGQIYDEILNLWFSHFLFGEDNGAEDIPAVLAQSNVDQTKWERSDAWETPYSFTVRSAEKGMTVLDTDWAAAGINADNYDDCAAMHSSNMNVRYMTEPVSENVTVQGTVRVDLRAALHDGDAAAGFNAVNAGDADSLSFSLGSGSGMMDDVKLTVLLCDISDRKFDSIQTVDAERNTVPVETVKKGAIINGGGLPDFDEVRFSTVSKNYRVITRAYIDLCNPDSGYAPESAAAGIELKKGEFHDYHVYLNPSRYTVEQGHHLAVVIGTEDPVNCLVHKEYSVAVENTSVQAEIPSSGAVSESYEMQVR